MRRRHALRASWAVKDEISLNGKSFMLHWPDEGGEGTSSRLWGNLVAAHSSSNASGENE